MWLNLINIGQKPRDHTKRILIFSLKILGKLYKQIYREPWKSQLHLLEIIKVHDQFVHKDFQECLVKISKSFLYNLRGFWPIFIKLNQVDLSFVTGKQQNVCWEKKEQFCGNSRVWNVTCPFFTELFLAFWHSCPQRKKFSYVKSAQTKIEFTGLTW